LIGSGSRIAPGSPGQQRKATRLDANLTVHCRFREFRLAFLEESGVADSVPFDPTLPMPTHKRRRARADSDTTWAVLRWSFVVVAA
jgi:hypothetical protein